MRAILLCLGILLGFGNAAAVVTEIGSIRGFVYGYEANSAYSNWISHASERQVSNLNVYAPWDVQTEGFGDYFIPTQLELDQWEAVVVDFLSLDLVGAQAKIDTSGFPYEVVQFQDIDSGRLFYMLRELLNDDYDTNGSEYVALHEIGSFDYGWGLYIYNPSASRPIIVNAPHPCDDYPSPVIALEAFLTWDARFLMIAGAGREVAYFPPYNSNNQSISDPSRFEQHPFNYAYRRFADQIRGLTGKIELSVQIHTYDWNKYPNEPNVMLSAGNQRNYPALPIRDDSRGRNDLINNTPWIVIPAGALGNGTDVTVYDYYSVYYDVSFPVRYDHDGTDITLFRNNTLPGAPMNQQMLYTIQPNVWDIYSPFLHVELDELPKVYTQNTTNWSWFYGYDSGTQSWDVPNRFTRFIAYYMPFVNALNSVLNEVLALDDHSGPSNPQNLRVSESGNFSIQLSWERSYAYDFDSYEISCRYVADGAMHHIIYDRNSDPQLAWQALQSFTINMYNIPQVYYFRLRARDKNGNYSVYTNELKVFRGGTNLSSFIATPSDNQVVLEFACSVQNIHGFKIFRAVEGSNFESLSDWVLNPLLLPNANGTYVYSDTRVQNGTLYRYRIGYDYLNGADFIDWRIRTVSPYRAYVIRLTNGFNGQTDDMQVGISPLASDALDGHDIERNPSGSWMAIVSWLSGGTTTLARDIRRSYPLSNSYKVWNLKTVCYTAFAPLSMSADPEMLLSAAGDLLLFDETAGIWHDLRDGSYAWINTSTSFRHFKLYWGYQIPRFEIPHVPDFSIPQGGNYFFAWQTVNHNRLQSLSLSLLHDQGELTIAEGLPTWTTQFDYTAIMAPLLSARLKITGHLSDGSSLTAISSWQFDVVPFNISFQEPAGYSLISVPILGFEQSLSSLLGSQALAWRMNTAGNWQPTQNISFGNAHLIRHPQAWNFAPPSTANTQVYMTNVLPGWNTLPNPHYHRYRVADLRYIYQGVSLSHSQALAAGLTISKTMLLDKGSRVSSDVIPPLKGFQLLWLGAGPAQIVFDPSIHDDSVQNQEDIWHLRLRAEDGYMLADAVELGSADAATEDLDAFYDLPKPTELPMQSLRLSLFQQSGAHHLQSEYKGLYPFYDEHGKTWQIRLYAPENSPLRFSMESFALPPDYSVELILNGSSTMLIPNGFVWVDPGAAGYLSGSIVVRSFPYSPRLPNRLPQQGFSAFPNPFKDGVSIRLDTIKNETLNLAVYNIRGQKVRELYNGKPLSGKLELFWDGKDESSRQTAAGIYFIRVSSPSGSVQRKILRGK
ncbi:MAG: T9SS type A sorting domain-containing protein [Candidatus Cloacimonadaceae bacterium]|nr:T9SS type A sorting domain-containing protein [Candidatus Cloacimonadaceae bacterium]